ncbi:MAG: PAS domain-containing sensor histidine kinase, partial [Agathobaculum butyriciproducens]|nr:PAS domain-containing sensor histidine kinase [Agathobaculum butyriciproducens]
MTDKKRGGKTKYSLPQRWRSTAVALLVLFALIGGSCARYVLFVSQTVYQESTSHLSELVHQSDDMLNQLFSRNRMILHLWGGLLEIASSEEQIRSGMDKMQKEIDCAALYFLASDGSCMTPDGERVSLGSQVDLDTQLFAGEDVVVNTALPGKPQMLVFACPEIQGIYRGFAYDAVAIAYYNDTVLSAIDSTAFEGTSHNYVVYPDGRVVLDSEAVGENGSEESVYNFLAELRSSSNLSDKAFDALSDDFAQGRDGSKMLTLHGTRYYLVYENTGIQDWIMLSLVPVSVVNASMDTLWHRTVEIVTAIACLLMVLLITLIVHRSRDALRRRDTEILYKDELFTRLSRNVDDVFFMLDAETSRTDYVSPNIERLLGVPLEQVRQDIRALRALHPKDSPDHDKNFFAGIQCGEQCEWNADYAHQQTGERRWFHVVVMGSEVAGR